MQAPLSQKLQSKKGATIIEMAVMTMLLAGLMLVLSRSISNVGQNSRNIVLQISKFNYTSQMLDHLSDPNFVKTAILEEAENSGLRLCLHKTCLVGETGPVFFPKGESIFGSTPFRLEYRVMAPNIVALKAIFDEGYSIVSLRSAEVYLSRRDFVPLPEQARMHVLNCDEEEGHLVGVELEHWQGICRPLEASSENAEAYSIPLILGRSW